MITRRLKKNKGFGLIKLIFFPCLLISVFAVIWLRTAVLNVEYGVSQLQKERDGVIRNRKLLLAERANFYSVKNIEETAIKGGMSLPERGNIFFVKSVPASGVYGVSARAVPEATTADKYIERRESRQWATHFP